MIRPGPQEDQPVKLYDMRVAPNPRRVRIFLAEKGIEIPRVEINIRSGENLKPGFLAINPRGVLPTLQLEDGTVIDESVAICRYFEELQPDPPLMGRIGAGEGADSNAGRDASSSTPASP
jgi:glutathione S-transferase